ncbi:hypothetical protein [Citrobacter sp.]|uniref:hypothetical protein n=1 Tax=Citrobacter sp. TaxID=1896336 RepID=UPI002FC5FF53
MLVWLWVLEAQHHQQVEALPSMAPLLQMAAQGEPVTLLQEVWRIPGTQEVVLGVRRRVVT